MSDNKMELIKELRARTNSSLIDCKKALEATSYDVEAAIDWLKKNGIVKAAKKAGRIAAEGAVIAVGNENRAVIVEINSETDFVAKNEKFVSLLNEVSNEIFKNNVSTLEEALKIKLNDGSTIENALLNATAVIGEKISLRRFNLIKALEQEKLGIYVHANQRVAAIVKVKGSNVEAAKNVAMHVSAMNPEFTLVSDIPASRIESIKSQFEKPNGFENKPVQIQEKIQSGWFDKQLSEFVLEKQPFVMEDSLSVQKYLANHNDELVEVIRYEVGEGIEKAQSDFAAEVASMVVK
ncbi:translation elongation factor Ts [Mycoplasmopsis cynos]|uniref:Elongation factor Ts n=1 Tax=Mycoplasmopsis cynos TaxID=171284 RepID=A0ABD8AI81_9BACT|nr:translation elongation factor Ts [Mycoplasmopsis cynos]WQQ12818.1 translation elongation factor Ts [Mycoplasmopsis cynos]WQQ14027.1 translation elongation factor Ts [Mycoplasmopsis cynos]WQQ15577.1 translation elongation factor Ts [Mycoplasmopsis cynos]WQQ19029.1 translation elongation factor Ts [Mycoplasmopsis cynos]WQQ19676.1 translation elongation factor Ts [Mycoplasmopsis cynos]